MIPSSEQEPRSSVEREPERESRETKEAEKDPELLAAAQLERADYLVKEVKSNKQQMQNIIIHMNQVQQAIAQIRNQLGLLDTKGSPVNEQDSARVQTLQAQIAQYRRELVAMQGDLKQAYLRQLRTSSVSALPEQELEKQANEFVHRILAEASDEKV